MTVEQIVKKYRITVFEQAGEKKLSVDNSIGKSASDIAFVRSNKAAIIAHLEAAEAEKQETAKHTVRFYVTGWEAHQVSVDDRKDLDTQFAEWADYYADDSITLEMVRDAYNKHIAAQVADRRSEIANLERFIAENDGKNLITATEYAAWRKSYNNLHNEGGEGYIPYRATQEDLQAAKDRLLKIK